MKALLFLALAAALAAEIAALEGARP